MSIVAKVVQKLNLLTKSNVNVSRSVNRISRAFCTGESEVYRVNGDINSSPIGTTDEKTSLANGMMFDQISNAKIDFLEVLHPRKTSWGFPWRCR